jgi:AmmeMemoRadiSam system protein B/AmmeMemoRadiSam system protein A
MIPAGFEDQEIKVRPAAKAGSWYDGNPSVLKQQIERFFLAAEARKPEEPVRALISPHAGYVYSGQTAAFGFKNVEPDRYKRVIVLAPSHYARFDGGSILDVTHYETPMGRMPLDRERCDELLKYEYFTSVPAAHAQEHSLELQLPFLQYALKSDFKLVPIVIGNVRPSWYEPMADLLLPLWDEETLVVASSDFTHYGSNFGYVPFKKDVPENLKKLDMGAVEKILKVDYQGFNDYIDETAATICGRKAIGLLLCMAAKKGYKAQLMKYTTSGELTGDYSHSVSYASICFTGTDSSAPDQDGYVPLTAREQETLLELARHTLKTFLETGEPPDDLDRFDITESMKRNAGAFVTLKKKGHLRGCIGYLQGIKPMYKAIIDNTISAASRDPRFPAVSRAEEAEIHMEISVLSPVVKVKKIEEIQVGRDGLIITRGFRRGTLLPQVPVEQGWDRTQFLEHSCMKAGLPRDAYTDPKTLIERYSAQVFSEHE